MTWMQQGDSAVRLHFLGSLAGLGAHTKIPKKSLLDCTPLDLFLKGTAGLQRGPGQSWLPPQEDFGSGTNRSCQWCWDSSTDPGASSSLLLAAEAGMPRATQAWHPPVPNPFWGKSGCCFDSMTELSSSWGQPREFSLPLSDEPWLCGGGQTLWPKTCPPTGSRRLWNWALNKSTEQSLN